MNKQNSVEEMSRLLEARLREWRLREKDPQYRPKPVVTITREPGCGGESIAQRLSAELGLHLYDWALVEQIASDEDVNTQLLATLEHNPPTAFEEWLAELQGKCTLPAQAYLGSLKRVLLAIAIPGNAVIVGRGSNFFLPSHLKIGLCFVAPLDLRIKNTMQELGVSEKDARKYISKLEAEHRQLAETYCQADIRDATYYHLVVNTALVKPETIVEMVKEVIRART